MENIILRKQYLDKIRPFYDSKYIKAITGIRRCGKSELIKQIVEEIKDSGIDEKHIIVLNLEGRSGEGITTRLKLEKKLDSLITDKEKYYIFIDEVQHIKKFEEAIASVRISYNCSLFVTGSNSRLLHGKLQDRLTGRAKEFELYPFTYKESLEYKKANNIEINENDFQDYLKNGGMPQRYEEQDDVAVKDYLRALCHSIIEKDVYGSHKKINHPEFENIAKHIISTTGKPFSALSIGKYLKNSKTKEEQKSLSQTINNYAEYLQECYFITECSPYYLKGKERLNGVKKYYPVDTGLRNAFNEAIEFDDTFALEAVVFNELITRGYEVSYGKLRDGEIDFVVKKGTKKCLMQVAYSIANQATFDREYKAFDKIKDHSPKYVLSLDKKDTSNNGITHLNIMDFLLGKEDIHLS